MMLLHELTQHLRALGGVRHKLDIQQAASVLAPVSGAIIGDDCAAISDGDGYLLFAIEGLLAEFVVKEPWFAGYCAVMANVSDVYSMGGRPLALVDAIWTAGADHATPIWEGMHAAADKYGIPIVGGHTNSKSSADYLAAAILGRAGKNLLTSFAAKPGDDLIFAIDLRGEWYEPYPYWNASTNAPGDRLRADLEILPRLAEAGLCSAAKDVSMGGVIGTATMLAEGSQVGITIDIEAIPSPPNASRLRWLSSFPSYGFLLAVAPQNNSAVCEQFAARQITAAKIGSCDTSRVVRLRNTMGEVETFWDLRDAAFTGFAPRAGGS